MAYNQGFTSTGAVISAEPLDGWTIKDLPRQEEKVDEAVKDTEAMSADDLAYMKAESARRIAAVKAEVGNTTEAVQAEIAEAELNATTTEKKAKASNKRAYLLNAEAEVKEAKAKAYVLDVQTAADQAKDEINSRVGTMKAPVEAKMRSAERFLRASFNRKEIGWNQ